MSPSDSISEREDRPESASRSSSVVWYLQRYLAMEIQHQCYLHSWWQASWAVAVHSLTSSILVKGSGQLTFLISVIFMHKADSLVNRPAGGQWLWTTVQSSRVAVSSISTQCSMVTRANQGVDSMRVKEACLISVWGGYQGLPHSWLLPLTLLCCKCKS